MKIIGGKFGGRVLKTPGGEQTRPTTGMTRAAVFNICQQEIVGARFLDLFAGSGAMGFEALSRGADWVTFVEEHKGVVKCIRENMKLLGVETQCQVVQMSVVMGLARVTGAYDLIYIDPPYDSRVDDVMNGLIAHNLVAKNGTVFLETRYTPQAPVPEFAGFQCTQSRRYGITHLHQLALV